MKGSIKITQLYSKAETGLETVPFIKIEKTIDLIGINPHDRNLEQKNLCLSNMPKSCDNMTKTHRLYHREVGENGTSHVIGIIYADKDNHYFLLLACQKTACHRHKKDGEECGEVLLPLSVTVVMLWVSLGIAVEMSGKIWEI